MASKGSRLFDCVGRELGIKDAQDTYKEMRDRYKKFLYSFLIERKATHRVYPIQFVRYKPYLFDQVVDFSIMEDIDLMVLSSYGKSLNVVDNKDIFSNIVMAIINFAILNGNVGLVKLEGVSYAPTNNNTFKFINLKDYVKGLIDKKGSHHAAILENCDTIIKNIFHWHNNCTKCQIESEDLLYAVKEVKKFRESIS